MARKQPSKQGDSRAHEAAEASVFERGEKEGLKEAVVQHLSDDAKEGKKHAAKDRALAKRVKKGK